MDIKQGSRGIGEIREILDTIPLYHYTLYPLQPKGPYSKSILKARKQELINKLD